MQAIILVGGLGTRLKKVVSDVPKPMADVNGRPFLSFIIEKLVRNRINNIILAIGYKGDIIKDYFKNGNRFNCNIEYSVENTQLGTGGAVINARNLITDNDILVMNGDTYFNLNLKDFIDSYHKNNTVFEMALRKIDNANRYGAVEFDGQLNINKFVEKGVMSESSFINGGMYILNKNILDKYDTNVEISMEKCIIPDVLDKYGIKGYLSEDYFIDIGIPEDYYKFIRDTSNSILRKK